MAESEKSDGLQEQLKHFNQRASEAEMRLSRLDMFLASKQDSGNEELSNTVSQLQAKLDDAKSELVSEREKASKEIEKLAAENAKLQYRIIHLLRALKEAESKLESN